MTLASKWLFLFVLWSFWGLKLEASGDKISFKNLTLQAQQISRDGKNQKLTLKGNVKILYKDIEFSAEDAEIDLQKQTIKVIKEVKFRSKDVSAKAERITYNYKEHTGMFYEASLKAGRTTFEGESIEQKKINEYVIKNGFYTSCSNCPPLWSFSSSEIHAVIGEYAYIKHPKLRIFKAPVLYSPVFAIPLKTKRQTGLLQPFLYINELGTLAFSQSYFWAISRNTDLTLTGLYYFSRGFKWLSEYRYILNENAWGHFKGGTISDGKFNEGEGKRRWFLEYEHYQELARHTVHRANLSWVSDIQYPQEFPRDIPFRGEPALENSISLTKNWDEHHFSVRMDYYVNLLKKGPNFRNDDAVHRLPSISYAFTEKSLFNSPLKLDVTANYVNFFRNGPGFDDVESEAVIAEKRQACNALDSPEKVSQCLSEIRYIKEEPDGVFDPSRDLVRTGERLEVKPTVSLPFQVGRLINITPSLVYKQSYYFFDSLDKGVDRTKKSSVETSLRFETQAQGVFKRHQQSSYQHKFKQILEFSHIPWAKLSNHFFFGDFDDRPFRLSDEILTEDDFYSENLGTGKVQFDYNDRLFRKKILSYTLINEIRKKRKSSYDKLMVFSLSQYYDFNQRHVGNISPWSPFFGRLQLKWNEILSYSSFKYYNSLKQMSLYSSLNFSLNEQISLLLSYDRSFKVDSQGEVVLGSFSKDFSFDVGFRNSFLKFNTKINYSTVTNTIKSWEYFTSIYFPGDCWQVNFGQIRPLNSSPIFQLNFQFQFNE